MICNWYSIVTVEFAFKPQVIILRNMFRNSTISLYLMWFSFLIKTMVIVTLLDYLQM